MQIPKLPSPYELFKNLAFRLDAEQAHYLTMHGLQALADVPPVRAALSRAYRGSDEGLARTVFGVRFANPVGLAAGFDKDARFIREMALLGFGHVEIGTLTPRPQDGNPKPRLFRLPLDRALVNRMGFNNEGVEAASARLEQYPRPEGLVIGGNIGKNKDTPNERASSDYLTCLKRLTALVDYFVVNVSSPNTPGLRELQEENQRRQPRPLLLKIAPDLEQGQLDDILGIAAEARLAGIVATNTTLAREPLQTPEAEWKAIGAGGLSGAPLRERSGGVLRYLAQNRTPGLALVGVGGIDSPEAAAQRLQDGADLLQVYSGLVYEGPTLVRRIKDSLRAKAKG